MTLSNSCNKFVEDALVKAINWAEEEPQADAYKHGPTRARYVQGFVRKPGMGSYALIKREVGSTEPVTQLMQVLHLFESFEWTEFTEQAKQSETYVEGYKYFQGVQLINATQYKLLQSVCSLYRYPPEKLAEVRVVQGPHGLELQAPGEPEEASVITAIVDETGMLVTWFPGFIVEPCTLWKQPVKLYEVPNVTN